MKALRRSGLPPDALCSIVDPLETHSFRVIAQLAEGYYRVCIPWDGGWVDQLNPELIDHIIAEIMDCHSGTLTCLFPDELALLVFDWDCLNLSIYHPSAEMQQLLAPIAASEGLFFRAAET